MYVQASDIHCEQYLDVIDKVVENCSESESDALEIRWLGSRG